MPQQNEPYRPDRHRSYSPRASSRNPQRVNVPHARDELERERELYSAHDPRQSAKTPAQRVAEAQSHQADGHRHTTRIADSVSSETLRGTSASSGRMPRVSSATPAGASGHMPRIQDDANVSGRMPRTSTPSNPSASGRMEPIHTETNKPPAQNRPSASGRMPHTSGDPSASGHIAAAPSKSLDDYGASRYLGSRRSHRPLGSTRNKIVAVVAAVAVVAIGVVAFQTWQSTKEVQVTINGEQKTIAGDQRSLEGLLNTSTVSVKPGNYIAIDGSVMREGEGARATANVNGTDVTDLSLHLNDGDTISLNDGTDITEQYTDSNPQPLPASLELKGTGAVHLYVQQGEPGEKVTRTGQESGKTAEITTKEPVNGLVQCYNVNSNGEKVIALTFDDGPWDSSTAAILDILKENGAKATFYTVGQKIVGHEDLLKRAIDEGHEVGTHTWDHAEGSGQGVSLILMSPEERKAEVEKGLQAIRDATGTDPSLMFRSPGGNFDQAVATDLNGIVTADIGWNVDTTDWKRPGADTIAQRIESVGPGEIVLMHDGGGDRSQTVEALRQALPKLKEQGYTFVTIGELLNRYPYQEGQGS